MYVDSSLHVPKAFSRGACQASVALIRCGKRGFNLSRELVEKPAKWNEAAAAAATAAVAAAAATAPNEQLTNGRTSGQRTRRAKETNVKVKESLR